VQEVYRSMAGLTEEAAGKMGGALEALGAQGAEPRLPAVEEGQKAALELLEKALAEADRLPKQEPPPEQKKDEQKKDGEKKDGEKKDGEKKEDQKKDAGKKEGKDEKKAEEKMSKEEAEAALRKFLEKDEERQRDRERRVLQRTPGRAARDKDW